MLNSCCFGIKEKYLGNNIYLSEYDNVDRRILFQEKRCTKSGIEIVPMTILEIAYNSEWIIAKSANKRKEKDFKYWIIKNNHKPLPDSKTVIKNTIEFNNYVLFESFMIKNHINLKLKKID